LKDWFENDEFWRHLEPFLFDDERLNSTCEEIDQIVALLKLKLGSSVLDLCCGPGRHSLELARRGYMVTGVDRTDFYLTKAKKQARKENLPVEFLKEDMRRFIREEAFNSVMLMFTSFGYFEKSSQDYQVLDNVFQSLKKNGLLLLDLMGKEIVTRTFQHRDWRELNGSFLLEERKPDEKWENLSNRWILFKKNSRHEFQFEIRIYSAVELSNLLKDCGFRNIDVYGDLKGSAYDHAAKRLVVVAKK
jgi:SAM-dependent methyltransferase